MTDPADPQDKETELQLQQPEPLHAAGRCLRLGFDADNEDLGSPLAMLMIHLSHIPYEPPQERRR